MAVGAAVGSVVGAAVGSVVANVGGPVRVNVAARGQAPQLCLQLE